MRLLLGTLLFLGGVAFAGELEVRAYRVGVSELREAHREMSGDLVADYGGDDWLGEAVKKAPFMSRFFREGGRLRDCSERAKELFAGEKVEVAAVYDLAGGHLVVRGNEMSHLMLAEILEEHLIYQMSTEVAVMARVEGQEKLRSVVSSLHLLGQEYEARSEDGSFVIRGVGDWGRDDFFVDNRVEWKSTIEGAEFELKTSLTTMREVSSRIELGMVGDRELVAVVTQERVLANGIKFEEWIFKEQGGAFLKKERLEGGGLEFWNELAQREGVRLFDVPPGFMDFITTSAGGGGGDLDPFAADETEEREVRKLRLTYRGEHPALNGMSRYELYDVSELLRENGVNIRGEDFAFYKANHSVLLVNASGTDLELVDGIIQACLGGDTPKMIRLNFRKVEAEGGIDRRRMESPDFELLEVIGLEVLPGQSGTIKLGEDLIVAVDGQIDYWNEIVEVRAALSEEEQDLDKASFQTAMTLALGVPVAVHQVRKGDTWQAWVVTAEVAVVGVNQ